MLFPPKEVNRKISTYPWVYRLESPINQVCYIRPKVNQEVSQERRVSKTSRTCSNLSRERCLTVDSLHPLKEGSWMRTIIRVCYLPDTLILGIMYHIQLIPARRRRSARNIAAPRPHCCFKPLRLLRTCWILQ